MSGVQFRRDRNLQLPRRILSNQKINQTNKQDGGSDLKCCHLKPQIILT